MEGVGRATAEGRADAEGRATEEAGGGGVTFELGSGDYRFRVGPLPEAVLPEAQA